MATGPRPSSRSRPAVQPVGAPRRRFGTVCQVNRSECEIILCQDTTRTDKARLFISLTAAGLLDLRRQLAERSVSTKETWWGYDCIQVDDPDGNELLFPIAE